MNIFLTGKRGIGKSTIIDRTLAQLDNTPGGFRTCYDDKTDLNKTLFLCSADLSRSRVAAHFTEARPQVFPDVFETFGTALLNDGLRSPLLLMDELGLFEDDCETFKTAVFSSLSSPVPVLGVLRETYEPCWLDDIRAREDILLFTVSEENRDSLPEQLAELLRSG